MHNITDPIPGTAAPRLYKTTEAQRARARAYHRRNRDRIRRRKADYRRKNRRKINAKKREAARAQRTDHAKKARINARKRAWAREHYRKNRERIIAKQIKWRKAKPERQLRHNLASNRHYHRNSARIGAKLRADKAFAKNLPPAPKPKLSHTATVQQNRAWLAARRKKKKATP